MSKILSLDEQAKILLETKDKITYYAIKFAQKIISAEQLKSFITFEMKCLKAVRLDNCVHSDLYNEINTFAKQTISESQQAKLP